MTSIHGDSGSLLRSFALRSLGGWIFDRRVDFGVLEVAEGSRPEAVRTDRKLQEAADRRLRELRDDVESALEKTTGEGSPSATDGRTASAR